MEVMVKREIDKHFQIGLGLTDPSCSQRLHYY